MEFACSTDSVSSASDGTVAPGIPVSCRGVAGYTRRLLIVENSFPKRFDESLSDAFQRLKRGRRFNHTMGTD